MDTPKESPAVAADANQESKSADVKPEELAKVEDAPSIVAAIMADKTEAEPAPAPASKLVTAQSTVSSPTESAPAAQSARPNLIARMLSYRHLPLAATIAIAACFGAIAGSFGTASLTSPPQQPQVMDSSSALKATIAQLQRDIAAFKNGFESSGRAASTQIARLAERLDRAERAQADQPSRLSKLSEAIERLERRIASAASPETTGSIAKSQQQVPSADASASAKTQILDGWALRGVYNGVALVQGRYGMIEVEPGDSLPGLGRVENIRRQDGRWVVVTAKGLIVAH
jgi:hypothetical protein